MPSRAAQRWSVAGAGAAVAFAGLLLGEGPARAEDPPRARLPKYSIWAGGRLGVLGYGYAFYENPGQKPETTGALLQTGGTAEVDLGVRFARRFTPYAGFELGVHPPGRRIEGEPGAYATSMFAGIGFRYVAGDTERLGFVADLASGVRWITIRNDTQSYTMHSVELFRLGLGAEFRVSPSLVISPLLTLSGGAMSGASGSITFNPNQPDGIKNPPYGDPPSPSGTSIIEQTGYLVISVTMGAHFDLFTRY